MRAGGLIVLAAILALGGCQSGCLGRVDGIADTDATAGRPRAEGGARDSGAAAPKDASNAAPQADASGPVSVPTDPKDAGTDAGIDSGSVADCSRSGCEPAWVECCDGKCVDLYTDPRNCGRCGHACKPGTVCLRNECLEPLCQASCDGGMCCGFYCCTPDEVCCAVPVGPGASFLCLGPFGSEPTPRSGYETLTETGACPAECPQCTCASPDTPIATPSGERAIAELSVGDLVFSVDRAAIAAVPVVRVGRTRVDHHRVVRVVLANGRALEVSGPHPLGDGRTFADLHPGAVLDGTVVVTVEWIAYEHEFTYDILPGSDTGTYFAAGVLVGSTLVR